MTTQTEVRIFSDPDQVANAIVNELLFITGNSKQPRFDIALPGGKTPRLLFQKLAEITIDEIEWNRIHFWWGDERCVPPDDPESNFFPAFHIFFSKIEIPFENIHRIRGEDEPETESVRYSGEIVKNLRFRKSWPVFDLILLGMGEDGHTASIFPGQPGLFHQTRICAVSVHPQSGKKRITLTGNVLNNARRIFFLVTGMNKSLRISEIINNDETAKSLPAYCVSPQNGILVWFLDKEAANLIDRSNTKYKIRNTKCEK